jgi:hypothetical protein
MMGKNITYGVIALLVVLGNVVWGAEKNGAASETIKTVQSYKFSTAIYSCTLHKTGMVLYLKAYNKDLLKSVLIFGDIVYAGKRERLRQNVKAKTWQLTKTNQESIFVTTGTLFSKSKEPLVDFKQKIILEPRQIKFFYEITTAKVLTIKGSRSFYSIMSAPIEAYLGSAMDVIDKNGDESIWEIPKVFQKNGVAPPKSMQSAEFSLSNGSFSIIIPSDEPSWMRISDARAWKSQKLEILLMPIIKPGPRREIIYPVGTVIKWHFTLAFE